MQARLPDGFGVTLSPRTHVCADGRSLVAAGGRVLRLAPEVADAVARMPLTLGAEGPLATVARLLLDRGAVEPWWPAPPPPDAEITDVTLVVPTRDRAAAVRELLAGLPPHLPVVLVDDGSRDPGALDAVAAAYDVRLVRHPANRGPAAARNTGLREVATPYVAFCDSDVRPEAGWLAGLRRHLDDPEVAMVGPRVLGRAGCLGGGWIARYEQDRSSLDLGRHAASVQVHGAVSYLPAACLLARVEDVRAAGGFEESMRCGEDVDLVWRLLAAGHRVRYQPECVVRHDHRTALGPWLVRKGFYGTSAAPLTARHPGAVAPLVATPWTAVWTVALLAQRRWSVPAAALALTATTVSVARRLEPHERPVRTAAVLATEGVVASTWQVGSALTRHYWPLALAWATVSGRGRRALLAAGVVEGLADRRRVGSTQPAAAYVVAHRLDDLAYGAGLWWGALQSRSPRALVPVVRWPGRRGLPREVAANDLAKPASGVVRGHSMSRSRSTGIRRRGWQSDPRRRGWP